MPRYPIDLEEALRRLSDKLQIEAWFQHGGVTHTYTIPREHAVLILERCPDQIEESGYFGQRMNMGLHVPLMHRIHGFGLMFLETRPEARISDQEHRERERAMEMGIDKQDKQ